MEVPLELGVRRGTGCVLASEFSSQLVEFIIERCLFLFADHDRRAHQRVDGAQSAGLALVWSIFFVFFCDLPFCALFAIESLLHLPSPYA